MSSRPRRNPCYVGVQEVGLGEVGAERPLSVRVVVEPKAISMPDACNPWLAPPHPQRSRRPSPASKVDGRALPCAVSHGPRLPVSPNELWARIRTIRVGTQSQIRVWWLSRSACSLGERRGDPAWDASRRSQAGLHVPRLSNVQGSKHPHRTRSRLVVQRQSVSAYLEVATQSAEAFSERQGHMEPGTAPSHDRVSC